ncbi:hypothetical protein SEA_WEASELS2_92 [Rhodococcus phage Weasels2]|uniref:Uncharacterized protein n=1 Tax=Rhodococcus phage Weasels2 TaxID=1897437 RepID=A0A1I9SA75_9CAUD|nr:hypothetical protein FDH04_gp092 [Rhodococcus phage Weasels2]AOZ63681.1 hypothetical protein SEA_WEASELS2_92 [Rhodococcus phage Weasels2]
MLAILVFVAAVLVVIATSVLKTVDMSKNQKNAIATVVSVVGGAIAVVVENGGFDNFLSAGLMATILMVYGAAQLVYKFLLPESVEDKLALDVGNTVK